MRKKEIIINYVSHIMASITHTVQHRPTSSGGYPLRPWQSCGSPRSVPSTMQVFLAKERQLTWRHSLLLETIFSDKLLCNSEDFPYSWPLDHTSLEQSWEDLEFKVILEQIKREEELEGGRGRERKMEMEGGRRGKSLSFLYSQLHCAP